MYQLAVEVKKSQHQTWKKTKYMVPFLSQLYPSFSELLRSCVLNVSMHLSGDPYLSQPSINWDVSLLCSCYYILGSSCNASPPLLGSLGRRLLECWLSTDPNVGRGTNNPYLSMNMPYLVHNHDPLSCVHCICTLTFLDYFFMMRKMIW